MKSNFTSFGEFPDVDSCTQKLLFGYIGTQCNKLTIDVEDFAFNETEDGLLDWVFDEVFERVTDVLVKFGEQNLCLIVSQGAHLMLIYN